jgi:hypothetical protein
MSKHPELLTLIEQEFIDYRDIPMMGFESVTFEL